MALSAFEIDRLVLDFYGQFRDIMPPEVRRAYDKFKRRSDKVLMLKDAKSKSRRKKVVDLKGLTK